MALAGSGKVSQRERGVTKPKIVLLYDRKTATRELWRTFGIGSVDYSSFKTSRKKFDRIFVINILVTPEGQPVFQMAKGILACRRMMTSIWRRTSKECFQVMIRSIHLGAGRLRTTLNTRSAELAGLFYSVDLARDERLAGNPRLVEKFFVELCQEHCPNNWQEVDRESLAMATALKALDSFGSRAGVVGRSVGMRQPAGLAAFSQTNPQAGEF